MTLIARLEAAAEGSRELDAEIAIFLNPKLAEWERFGGELHGPSDSIFHAPHYTTSIDAALALVPEGWAWFAQRIGQPFSTGFARLWLPAARTKGLKIEQYQSEAATPALALVIAAMKARGLTMERGNG